AAGQGVTPTPISRSPQPLRAEKGRGVELSEQLLAIEGIVEDRLELFAKPGERVGGAAHQHLTRPGLVGTEIVVLSEGAERFARQLRDELDSARLGGAAENGARGNTGDVLDEQQVTFEIGIVDRSDPGQMLEKFVSQSSSGTDVAIKLDLADVAFDRAQDKNRASVDLLDFAPDAGENVAVGPIPGLEILDDGVEARSRHGGADKISIERGDRLRFINGDPLHSN